MTNINCAWVAGLLEGEGCFTASRRKYGIGIRSNVICAIKMSYIHLMHVLKILDTLPVQGDNVDWAQNHIGTGK